MYQQSINHIHRSAVVIAIDCSLSMLSYTHLHGSRMRKIDAATLIANYAIDELVARATRGNEVRNYYDIAVISYSGDGVETIIGNEYGEFIDIKPLVEHTPQPTLYTIEQQDSKGELKTTPITLHEWVKPKACGDTPMYEALISIKNLLSDWCDNPHNRESFPPLVINISDGGYSDADENEILDIARDIQELSTADGSTLFVNIHLATESDNTNHCLVFATDSDMISMDEEDALLYKMSSILPSELERVITELTGRKRRTLFRCFARNASICEVLAMADIGTEGCHGIKYR